MPAAAVAIRHRDRLLGLWQTHAAVVVQPFGGKPHNYLAVVLRCDAVTEHEPGFVGGGDPCLDGVVRLGDGLAGLQALAAEAAGAGLAYLVTGLLVQ